ncbi:unnamed protein product, partial [Oncorhynchus mykiss]
MGNLIKVLTRDIDNNAGNFFLDFENAQPTEAERAVWEQVNEVLMEALAILDDLQSYNGAGEEIRQAIQNPSEDQVQERAWAAVVPLVGKLKKFYEFSLRLGKYALTTLNAVIRGHIHKACYVWGKSMFFSSNDQQPQSLKNFENKMCKCCTIHMWKAARDLPRKIHS